MDAEKLLNQFVAYLAHKGRSEATSIAYKKDIAQLLKYCSETHKVSKLSSFNSEMLHSYVDFLKQEGKYTLKTISRKLNSVKTFFKYLSNEKLIAEDYAKSIQHPEVQQQIPRILSALEYRALRDVARTNIRLYTMVELLLQTGIRIGELSRLKTEDLMLTHNPPHLYIRPFSSNSGRNIELNSAALDAINDYLASISSISNPQGYLFFTQTGNMVLVRNIRTTINKAFIKAGISSATVNDIRNTFIVYQLENGTDIEYLAQVAGHQKPTTTERYLQLLVKRPKRTTRTLKPL